MGSARASGAVRTGQMLATALLLLALVLGALWAVSVVVGVARGSSPFVYGDELPVSMQISPDDLGPLPEGLELVRWPDVTLRIAEPTTEQILLRSALDVGPLVLFAWGLWLLRGFLGSVLAGDPFGPDNVRRLRTIGGILVVGALVVEVANSSLRSALLSAVPPYPSVDLGMPGFAIPAGALLAGLAVFILAEVFAYGLYLREEVEGTV